MEPTATYRSDIDGLRAIAVLSVLLYHLGYAAIPGGFTGVDVFFVISGHLITGIVQREIAAGTFSLTRFYERRARRILPALTVVIVATLAAGYFLLLPSDFAGLGAQAASAMAGLANVYFYFTTGYFERASDLLPLLHTWSLGVEEQFYVVWPLLLLLLWRRFRAIPILPILIGLIAVGFIVAEVSVGLDPQGAFYLPHLRAWELAVGGLTVFLPALKHRWVAEFLRVAGLALVTYAIFGLSAGNPFPGVNALFPVIGAALIVWPSQVSTWSARVLGWRPFVFVGLISYSLYLWHWPLIAFARLLDPLESLSPDLRLPLLAASFVLAYLSYRFVERPFRRSTGSRLAIPAALASIGVVAGAGLLVTLQEGLPQRLSPAVATLAAAEDDISPVRRRCHRGSNDDMPVADSCVLGADTAPVAMIWADSHGMEIGTALSEVIGARGQSLMIVTSSACAPAINVDFPSRPRCADHNRSTLAYLLEHPEIETVYLGARFEYYRRVGWEAYAAGFTEVVETLAAAGRTVHIIGPIPLAPFSVPQAAAKAAMAGGLAPMSIARAEHEALNSDVDALLAQLAALDGVGVVYPEDILCDADLCALLNDGHSLYFDEDHLGMYGARLVIDGLIAGSAELLPAED